MDKRILSLFLVLSLSGQAFASASEAGAIFLTIFPGAKATGMAGAFSAIADDATASYYNPGALAFFTTTQFSLIHANWLPRLAKDMYYEFVGFVKPLSGQAGAIGGHIIYLDLGNVEAYDENGNYLGTWNPHDLAITLAYGFPLNSSLGIGFAGKFIRSFLAPPEVLRIVLGVPGGGTASSFAFDAGVFYKSSLFPGMTGALVLQNFGPGLKFTATGERDPLPYLLRFGIAYRPIWNEVHKLTLSLDVNKILVNITKDLREKGAAWVAGEAFKHVGMEYSLLDIIALRVGYFLDREGAREGFTFGAGIAFKNFRFDIADDSRIYEYGETSNRRFSLTYVMQK